MPFWAYMLHCRGGAFYTGQTDDLEHRVAQHRDGKGASFTAERLPVELVWSQEFGSREEAKAAEARIKGWSRAKKLALIRGDWQRIRTLAKSKDGPSTSSGHAGKGAVSRSALSGCGKGTNLEGRTETSDRLDKALANTTDLSRERIKTLIAQGHVEIDGKPATSPSAKVEAGTAYRITLPAPEPLETEAQAIPLDIVFEDAHLIVVNKPAGMVVHPAAGNREGTLVNALLHHCRGQLSGINGVERPGIVHRIDKDTSGLLVVAKSDAAHEGLARQFAEHSITRRYLAVCAGRPNPRDGTVEGRIGRSDRDRKQMAVLPPGATRGKHAITHYRTLETLAHAALIECRLETGRTHQIRVHCQSIGHPLLGDPVYGRTPKALKATLASLGFARQALHAARLGFSHPISGESLDFCAELPEDMRELIEEIAR